MTPEIETAIAALDAETRRLLARRDRAVAAGRTTTVVRVDAMLRNVDERRIALADAFLPEIEDDIAEAAVVRAVERAIGLRAIAVTVLLTAAAFVGVFVGVL